MTRPVSFFRRVPIVLDLYRRKWQGGNIYGLTAQAVWIFICWCKTKNSHVEPNFACFNVELIQCKILFGRHKKVEYWERSLFSYHFQLTFLGGSWRPEEVLLWHVRQEVCKQDWSQVPPQEDPRQSHHVWVHSLRSKIWPKETFGKDHYYGPQ